MTNSIDGYRQLTDSETASINKIKAHGEALSVLIDELRATYADPRWISIGVTDLQTGLMALVRSVAQPTNF